MTTAIWLLPIMFMFHDLEEIVTVEGWLLRNRSDLARLLPARIYKSMESQFSMDTMSFAIAVSFMLLGVAFATVWAGAALDLGGSMLSFAAALAVFFLHAFMHIGQALVLRRYTPGVVTSILLVIPYSAYAYYRLLSEGLFTWKLVLLGVPVGFLCAVPLLLLGQWAGKRIGSHKNFVEM